MQSHPHPLLVLQLIRVRDNAERLKQPQVAKQAQDLIDKMPDPQDTEGPQHGRSEATVPKARAFIHAHEQLNVAIPGFKGPRYLP